MTVCVSGLGACSVRGVIGGGADELRVKGARAAAALTSSLAAPAGGLRGGVTSRAGWEGRGEREEQILDEAADALLQRVLRDPFHRPACVLIIRQRPPCHIRFVGLEHLST